MHQYAAWHTGKLLRKLASEARKVARAPEADAIHDLRVAIRRLRACLRVFAQFYPSDARKKLDRGIKAVMHAAGEVRDRDIAMEMLHDAGVPRTSSTVGRLRNQRAAAARALLAELKPWQDRGVTREWRKRLEV